RQSRQNFARIDLGPGRQVSRRGRHRAPRRRVPPRRAAYSTPPDVLVTKRCSRRSMMAQELVVNLHGIGTPHDGVVVAESLLWVTRQAFTMLLECILTARATVDIPTVITFDDGNASDVTIALPELAKRGLKASFFICARRIGTPFYLDRVALADLLAAGMEI